MDRKKKKGSELKKWMTAVGVYDKNYQQAIGIVSELLIDYEDTMEEWEAEGRPKVFEYTNRGGETNTTKHPLYALIEKQRADIILNLRELGLTPAGLKKIDALKTKEPERSKLDMLLGEIKKGKRK